MTATIDVSVVIPTIGRPELARAYRSVKAQNVTGVRIIVVLDAPRRERSVRAMLDDDTTLVVTEGRRGGAAARNVGLDHVTSEYVAFLDDDDWWDQDKLEQQWEMVECTGASLCFTAVDFVDGDRHRVLPEETFDPTRESIASYLVRRPRLRHGHGYLQSSTLLARSDLARRVRWDASLAKHQDWDYVIRLMDDPESVFAFCGAPLVHVQKGSMASVSATRDRGASEQWLDRHAEALDSTARGDFIATQLLRSSLATNDVRGVVESVKRFRRSRPSPAAVVVGLFGAAESLRARRAASAGRASSR